MRAQQVMGQPPAIWCLLQDEDAVQRLAERMRGLLEPFMLRRLKAEVAGQLAPKTQKVVQVTHCAPAIFCQGLSICCIDPG